MPLFHGSIALLLLLIALAAPRGVAAQPSGLMQWRDDGSCAAPHDAERQLHALLGAAPTQRNRRVYVTVRLLPGGEYELRLGSDPGLSSARVVKLARCDETQQTALLLAAMTLDPRRTEEPAPPPTPPRPPPRLGLNTQLGADFTTLPGVAPLLGFGVQLKLGALRLATQLRYAQRSTRDALPDGVEASLRLLSLAPGGCWLWSRETFSFGLCGELELGRLRAEASRVDDPHTQRSLFASVGAGGVLEYSPNRWVSLQLGLLGGPALRRQRFALVGEAPFHQVPSGVARATIGLTLWLPTTEPARAGH